MTAVELMELSEKHGHLYINPKKVPGLNAVSVILPSGTCAWTVSHQGVSESEYLEAVSHELGHCETHSFYTRLSAPAARLRAEETARRWSWRTMVPPDELFRQMERGLRTPWELAEYFNVPQKMVTEAVTYYRDVLGGQK